MAVTTGRGRDGFGKVNNIFDKRCQRGIFDTLAIFERRRHRRLRRGAAHVAVAPAPRLDAGVFRSSAMSSPIRDASPSHR